jgi:hypothetical protein
MGTPVASWGLKVTPKTASADRQPYWKILDFFEQADHRLSENPVGLDIGQIENLSSIIGVRNVPIACLRATRRYLAWRSTSLFSISSPGR